MPFVLCDKRRRIIESAGHSLVLGGPGAGKTTLALQKAKALVGALLPGQHVLFLSFSRSAVQQVVFRAAQILSPQERRLIEVQTYHSFCWEVLRAHGSVLGGRPLRMMTPTEECLARTTHGGPWEGEQGRLFRQDGVVCFDLFAGATADLLEQSQHLRTWLGRLHPLIIFDEFQDTDDDQWRLAKALATSSPSLFLADPDQRIYDFRRGVRPERVAQLRATLAPLEADLEEDNFRSGNSQIVRFANAVLRNTPLPRTRDVSFRTYLPFPNVFSSTTHHAVIEAFLELRRLGVAKPSVAVLATSNDLVADISAVLSGRHTLRGMELRPVTHEVVSDAELSAAAAMAVAAALEYASERSVEGATAVANAVEHFWLIKKDWGEQRGTGTQAAHARASRFREAARQLGKAAKLRRGAALALFSRLDALQSLAGDPVRDWTSTAAAFSAHADVREIASQARLVRFSSQADPLPTALGSLWLSSGSYRRAAEAVRRILDQERLLDAQRTRQGCTVMTAHKSKGKEFDAVVIVEGTRTGELLRRTEAPGFGPSRRLLRVAISRARHRVTIVRPKDARPLVG